jgi:hypothetical protein
LALVKITDALEKRAQDSRKIDQELGQQIFGSVDNVSLNFDGFDDSVTEMITKD